MSEKLCPALGTPCIKDKCIAYTSKQEEHYKPRLPWQKRAIDFVVLGYCSFLNVRFIVFAEEFQSTGDTPTVVEDDG